MEPDYQKYHEFLNGRQSSDTDELTDFLRKAGQVDLLESERKKSIWEEIEKEIEEDKPVIPIGRYLSIAAAIALVVVATVLLIPKKEKEIFVKADSGEKKEISLPDKSTIALNAQSEIEYLGEWNRKVYLKGEAYFEVSEGSTFTVVTDQGTVEVLGTSFNVYARENDLEVVCKTGRVKVTIPEKTFQKELSPGEKVIKRAGEINETKADINNIGQWTSGEFYYEEVPVSQVFKELERQFDVNIKVDRSIEDQFSGFFSNEAVESALETVCLPLGLTYELKKDSIVIKKSL